MGGNFPLTFLRAFALVVLLALTPGRAALAVDQSYLDALEDEAESSAALTSADALPPEAVRLELEALLQSRHPSTFKAYLQLNDAEQAEVTTVYAKRHRLSSATRKIAKLYLDK